MGFRFFPNHVQNDLRLPLPVISITFQSLNYRSIIHTMSHRTFDGCITMIAFAMMSPVPHWIPLVVNICSKIFAAPDFIGFTLLFYKFSRGAKYLTGCASTVHRLLLSSFQSCTLPIPFSIWPALISLWFHCSTRGVPLGCHCRYGYQCFVLIRLVLHCFLVVRISFTWLILCPLFPLFPYSTARGIFPWSSLPPVIPLCFSSLLKRKSMIA